MKWIILQKILSYGAVRTSEVPTISKSSRVCSCVHLLSLRRAGVLLYEEDSSVSKDIFNLKCYERKCKIIRLLSVKLDQIKSFTNRWKNVFRI